MSSRLISDCPKLWAQVLEKDGYITKGRGKQKVPISSLTVGSSVSIEWKCIDGKRPNGDDADDHLWEQVISARWDPKTQKSRRCPFCSGHRVCESNSLGAYQESRDADEREKAIKICEQWHSELNGDVTVFDVSRNQHDRKGTKYWWYCNDGMYPSGKKAMDHIWDSTVSMRWRGGGCPFCRGLRVTGSNCLSSYKDSSNLKEKNRAKRLIKEWSGDNQFTPEQLTPQSHKEINWICSKFDDKNLENDHIWPAKLSNRWNGKDCPCCAGQKVVYSNSLGYKKHESFEILGYKNDLTPFDIVVGTKKEYFWKCLDDPDHEEYEQSPKSKFLGNAGCNYCKKKNERKVYEFCKEIFPKGTKIKRNVKKLFKQNPKMELDIYIEDYQIGIEYQGEQHYIARKDWKDGEKLLKEQQIRDKQKRKWCKQLGISLIEVKYDWKMDKNILVNLLSKHLEKQ